MGFHAARLRRALPLCSSLIHSSLRTPKSVSPIHSIASTISAAPNPSTAGTSPLAGLRSFRLFRSSPVSLSSRMQRFDDEKEITEDTILFEGCDYNHWLITVDFPRDKETPAEEKIATYERIASQVFGSIEEAKKKIYACSTTVYDGFQVLCSEDTSKKFEDIPGVVFVLPDSYIDPVNKQYGGDKYINGEIIHMPPPITYMKRDSRPRPRNDSRGYENRGPRNFGPPQQQNFAPPQSLPHQQQNFGDQQNVPRQQQNFSPSPNLSHQNQNFGPPQNFQSRPQNFGPPQHSQPHQPNFGPPQHSQPHQPNFGPPQHSRSHQQNFGPPQHPQPHQQNFGPPQHSPPHQQNFGPPQNLPPQQQNFGHPQNTPNQQNFAPQQNLQHQHTFGHPQNPSQEQHFGAPQNPSFQQNSGPQRGTVPQQNYDLPQNAPPHQTYPGNVEDQKFSRLG